MKSFVITYASLALLFVALPASAIDRGDIQRGEDKAAACLACHSGDAVENNPEWPRLHGQHADYLVRALRDYKSGKRTDPVMQMQVEDLTLQDKRDIASWFAAQNGQLYTPRKD